MNSKNKHENNKYILVNKFDYVMHKVIMAMNLLILALMILTDILD